MSFFCSNLDESVPNLNLPNPILWPSPLQLCQCLAGFRGQCGSNKLLPSLGHLPLLHTIAWFVDGLAPPANLPTTFSTALCQSCGSFCQLLFPDTSATLGSVEQHDWDKAEQLPSPLFRHCITCQYGSVPFPKSHNNGGNVLEENQGNFSASVFWTRKPLPNSLHPSLPNLCLGLLKEPCVPRPGTLVASVGVVWWRPLASFVQRQRHENAFQQSNTGVDLATNRHDVLLCPIGDVISGSCRCKPAPSKPC